MMLYLPLVQKVFDVTAGTRLDPFLTEPSFDDLDICMISEEE
jgi:hypothetical protein